MLAAVVAEKPIERTKAAKKEYVKKSPGKFEGDPTYRSKQLSLICCN